MTYYIQKYNLKEYCDMVFIIYKNLKICIYINNYVIKKIKN